MEVRHDQPAEVNGCKNVQVEEVAVHIEVGVVPSVINPTRLLPVPRLLSNYHYWGDTTQLFANMISTNLLSSSKWLLLPGSLRPSSVVDEVVNPTKFSNDFPHGRVVGGEVGHVQGQYQNIVITQSMEPSKL